MQPTHLKNAKRTAMFLSAVCLTCTGCWNGGLPAEIPVPLPDGSSVVTAARVGPPALANTDWSVYRDPDHPFLLFRIRLNENGDVALIYDNEVFSSLIGDEIVPNGEVQSSPIPGGNYVAEAYVAYREPYVGFVSLVNAMAGPLTVANGRFEFTGTRNGDKIDGTLNLSVTSDPAFAQFLPFEPGGYQFQVVGVPTGMDHILFPGDANEPDSRPLDARPIHFGQRVTHSFSPAGDADWHTFTITSPANVVIETLNTSADTVLWLYDTNFVELAYNDDAGGNLMSRIEMSNLPPGIYYFVMEEYGHRMVDSYDVQLTQF